MKHNQKKIIRFDDIKEEIVNALKRRSLKITESMTLIDGFVSEPFGKELSDSFIIGGPTIPMVMLVGEESGQVYFFALKAILPSIEL